MGGALGLRAARCEPFGRGLSGAAREQPATVGVGPARTMAGVLWGPRGTRTANGRGVRLLGSGARLKPSSADRPHLVWLYVVVAVWLPIQSVVALKMRSGRNSFLEGGKIHRKHVSCSTSVLVEKSGLVTDSGVPSSKGNALRSCWALHSAVGCNWKRIVGTVKKSTDTSWLMWFSRKVRHVWVGGLR